MSRYTGPRLRKVRRLDSALPGLTRKAHRARAGVPGQQSFSRRKTSDYALRLQEKQRLRYNYGLSERQLRNLFRRASSMKGDTGVNLLALLESRLDSAVFRAGFAPTIPAARQLVGHGHVLVDGRKVDIPSMRLKPGQNFEIREKSKKLGIVLDGLAEFMREAPSFLDVDRDAVKASFVGIPARDDVMLEIEMSLVIEFYSR